MDFVININEGARISVSKEGLLTSEGLKEECPYCGQTECYDHTFKHPHEDRPHEDYETLEEAAERQVTNARVDGMESLVLALAKEGYDITDERFKNAVITACDAIANN